MRFEVSGSCWRTSRTPEGPATLLVETQAEPRLVRVRAWGPGTQWALAQAPALLGLDDIPPALLPVHPAVAAALRVVGEVRIGRTGRVIEALVPAILEQKITGEEARRAYRGLIARWGEPAPGPAGLRLLPPPEVVARLPYHALHPIGLERRRAEVLAAVCRDAARLEALGAAAAGPMAAGPVAAGPVAAGHMGSADATRAARAAAYAALVAYPGIGPWTAAEVGMRAFGDPDAVSVGDFHLPNMVAWALAREPRGTDERMLELLEPYRGQRGRVVRLLELAGIEAPKYGPRLTPRRIDRI
jgi:3-methyladenine DNA glycosylase/8-oxoguanine DNA glycosylase